MQQDQPHGMPRAYDPMALYAKMARFYRFSLTEMDQMHFPTFFGFVREANLMNEEEKAEYDQRMKDAQAQGQVSPQEAESIIKQSFPEEHPYEGEVIEWPMR